MSIECKYSENDTVLTIGIRGVFNFSLLNDFRQAYTDKSIKSIKIIIDMAATTSMDSSALGMLLNMQEYLGKSDGEIRIIKCNADVMKVFGITCFDKKFNIDSIIK